MVVKELQVDVEGDVTMSPERISVRPNEQCAKWICLPDDYSLRL